MGVTGLWPILAPSARPTPLPTLNRKRLAVDASIWIYQFLKAVRDKEGNALPNSHVVGFFRRICKLLYYGILPVFVFDGGAPILKRQTIQNRKKIREGRREDAVRTAGKLLAIQMRRREEEEEEERKRKKDKYKNGPVQEEEEEAIIIDKNTVYVDETGMSVQERIQNRKFRRTDAYHLPELTNGIEGMGQPNDPRVMSTEELEEYAKQFNNGEDVNLYDFSKIDFNGDFFMSLPASDRYNILNAARLRSRLRMGLSKEQLVEMFPDRMAFSRFQIERVRERNELTQRLMNLNGMNDDLVGVSRGRIAGNSSREYVLVKNEGIEGGWVLGVVNIDKGLEGKRNRPIDVDNFNQPNDLSVDSEEEDEFEDVPVEGLNRLPKLKEIQNLDHEFSVDDLEENAEQKDDAKIRKVNDFSDTLFIEDNTISPLYYQKENEKDRLNRAIALSLLQDDDNLLTEDNHIEKAIALSLQTSNNPNQTNWSSQYSEYASVLESNKSVPQPQNQIKITAGGETVNTFNDRADGDVSERKAANINSDSDDEVDLQATLAKARRQAAPANSTETKSFQGPLPFETLGSLFDLSQKKKAKSDEVDHEKEDMGGGFYRETDNVEAPKPIPPWLLGQSDIRSDIENQKKRDAELNAEDRERAIEDEKIFVRDLGPVIIESSDEEDNLEKLNKLPPKLMPPPCENENRTLHSISENLSASIEINTGTNIEKPEETTVDPDKLELASINSGLDMTVPKNMRFIKMGSPKFEDVQISTDPNPIKSKVIDSSKSSSPVTTKLMEISSPKDSSGLAHMSSPAVKYDAERLQLDAEFNDYSDPDDEEVLAQLAIEAEEYGRFASTLNNKSELENRTDYERDLKVLRTQQRKDRRDADEVSQTMITECQALLRLFGIPYITAPMEAEAQCAELVRLGLVDGVVTDDCDIFLFGGTRVYKNMFNSNKYVECYLLSDIEKDLSLSRENLISIAHLLGSDYTEGLPRIGPVTALEIISEFPSISDFASWWSTAQSSTGPEISVFRKKFRRTQAAKLFLPSGFPSTAVTEAYLRPEVDSSNEKFQWGVPDLDKLREFLMATIGWSRERTDEVLVPVIRDMNRRAAEGTQSNITQFFEGGLGAGVRGQANTSNAPGRSKRMRDAVVKLKSKRHSSDGGLSKTFADEAREWALREKSGKNKGSECQVAEQTTKKKNKKKRDRVQEQGERLIYTDNPTNGTDALETDSEETRTQQNPSKNDEERTVKSRRKRVK
ncbi:putative dna excision repair protein [Golovinomyces cichoracearum]|uniref:Putative dna excision repair protein n=1 Tax=Golovinomyces cichoracearum TaxID=62708 RepID=A0A420JAC8_9PEZI|nr:putative dna excision repair protein [Golovinomyces cichoracearum]